MKYVLLMRHGKHTHVNPGDRSKRTVTKSGREDTREVIWKFVRDQEKLINCGNLTIKIAEIWRHETSESIDTATVVQFILKKNHTIVPLS